MNELRLKIVIVVPEGITHIFQRLSETLNGLNIPQVVVKLPEAVRGMKMSIPRGVIVDDIVFDDYEALTQRAQMTANAFCEPIDIQPLMDALNGVSTTWSTP